MVGFSGILGTGRVEDQYSKEKATEYYLQNKDAIKEKSRERYKNLSEEEKDKIKEHQRKKVSRTDSV